MNINQLLAELRTERDKLDRAITALEGIGTSPATRTKVQPKTTKTLSVPKKRGMSPAARKRMSQMMKARWAARKKGKKAVAAKA